MVVHTHSIYDLSGEDVLNFLLFSLVVVLVYLVKHHSRDEIYLRLTCDSGCCFVEYGWDFGFGFILDQRQITRDLFIKLSMILV